MTTADQYRLNAANCAQMAEAAENEPDKNRLKRMEAAWRALAEEQDWLDGEPDGDRPDERVAGSGCEPDQSNGSRDADEPWSASGVPTGQGLRAAGSGGLGLPEARPAEKANTRPTLNQQLAVQAVLNTRIGP
jgi:hypothetical protein